MANIKSNIKRATQNKKKYLLRKGQRSDLKSAIKSFKEEKNKSLSINDIYSKADKLAKKKAIPQNRANRIKAKAIK